MSLAEYAQDACQSSSNCINLAYPWLTGSPVAPGPLTNNPPTKIPCWYRDHYVTNPKQVTNLKWQIPQKVPYISSLACLIP